MKKIVKIGNKTFIVDSESKEVEEVEAEDGEGVEVGAEGVEAGEGEGSDAGEDAGEGDGADAGDGAEAEPAEDVEKKIKEATDKVIANLGLDKLSKAVESLETKMTEKSATGKSKKVSALLDLETLMKKDVGEMTSKEKIVGFFQAMLQSNHSVMKALSEGTAIDGGYLFPDEFRAEVIRDLADGNYMRNEVTVIPMKRDIMKIPSLESRPKVVWTEENTTKSTTTAHFNEKTLTVKKMAAINA